MCLTSLPIPAAQSLARRVSLPQVILDPTPEAKATFGVNIVALDFDRDGTLDLAIGAPGEDGANNVVGEVWIFRGPAFQPADALPLVSARSSRGDSFGSALAAGDLDGDGWEELVVGAQTGDPGGAPGAGYASIWQWRQGATQEICILGASVAEANSNFGESVVLADVDSTAGLEVLVGHSQRNVPPTGWMSGSFHIFSCQVSEQPVLLATIDNPNSTNNSAHFGTRMCTGDWNGDGLEDVYVTGIFNDVSEGVNTWLRAGQVFVYAGPIVDGAGPTVTIDNPTPWTDPQSGSCAHQRFGMYIAAEDIDGDGFDELVVGTPRKDLLLPNQVCDAGVGFLFSGANFTPSSASYIELLHPAPAIEDLMSYRVHFGEHIGDSRKDLVLCSLGPGLGEAFFWDGSSLLVGFGSAGAPTSRLQPLPDSAAHWPDGIESAELDGGGHEELILGDRDYTPPGGPNKAGRVVIYFRP